MYRDLKPYRTQVQLCCVVVYDSATALTENPLLPVTHLLNSRDWKVHSQDVCLTASLGAISDWRQKKNRCSYFSSRYVPHFNVGIVPKSYEKKKKKRDAPKSILRY